MTRSARPLVLRVFVVLTLVATLISLLPSATYADSPGLPPRPPAASQAAASPVDSLPPSVGLIELTAKSPLEGTWTVVQWQDALGDWHDVKGWQRALSSNGKVRWGVNAWAFGRGPFRWAVYAEQGGELMAASSSFYLPRSEGLIVSAQVSLPLE